MNLRKLLAWQPFAPWLAIAIAAVVVVIVAGVVLMFTSSQRNRTAAAVAGVETTLGQSHAASASEAGVILDQAHAGAAQSETFSRENADAILSAPGAGQRLDPELNRVARERMCKRAAYSSSAECLQLAHRAQP